MKDICKIKDYNSKYLLVPFSFKILQIIDLCLIFSILLTQYQVAPTLCCLFPSAVGSKPFIIAYLFEEKC